MIFLTSYDRDLNIFHPLGDVVREPTLHLCGEYQAPDMRLGLFFYYSKNTNKKVTAVVFLLVFLWIRLCGFIKEAKFYRNWLGTFIGQDDKMILSGCGAVGSALRWGCRGRKFKSCHPDQVNLL